ncbi:MAG: PEP-CTERM sorting domain-containing protein [Planctomycetota bacterium]|jgi:hypothetical protein
MFKHAVAVLTVMVLAAPAFAGALSGHADAFDDGSTVWAGSTAFDNGTGVAGYVDWAVFAPGDFPFAGYTPDAGELVYAYQVFSTGTDVISSFSVALENEANSLGSFSDLSGDAMINGVLLPAVKAEWQFAGITTGGNSEGLAFSSPLVPKELFGIAVDGGTFALVIPVPTPSSNEIPEPATMSLLGIGALTALIRRRR